MKIKKYFIPKKRSFIRLATFSIAIIAALSVFLTRTSRAYTYYENQTKTVRLRSLSQLCEFTSMLPDNLRKLACSSDPYTEISTDIIKCTSCAKICLNDFPQDNDSLSQIYKFYSQIDSVLISLNNGTSSINEEQDTLNLLADSAQNLTSRLEAVLKMCISGSLSLTEVPNAITNKDLTFYSYGLEYADDTVKDIQTESSSTKKTDTFLAEFETVTKKEAEKIAASFLNIEPVLLRETESSQNSLELYNFYYRDSFISITKNGGKICSFLIPCECSESLLSAQDAVIRAKETLKSLDYNDVEERHYFIKDNICTITFVHRDGEIICYPDIIRIKIALDNGETVGLDATEFLKNHKERNFKYDNTIIEGLVSSSLNVLRISPALILVGNQETLCHEILCSDNENEYLIYLSSEDATQKKFFKLEKSSNGTLIK